MQMDLITALVFIMLAMVIGEVISNLTKAFIPSVFVTAFLFLVGYWTFFPKEIVSIASLGQPFALLAMYILITHMGSMMNTKELLAQWKTVLISLAGIAGVVLMLLTVGSSILGHETALVGAPPLTGGIVAALLMQEAAASKGMEMLSILAILVYVAQGFVGYPITALLLKKEGRRLLAKKKEGPSLTASISKEPSKSQEGPGKKPLFPQVPERFNTTYMLLLKVSAVALLAARFSDVLNAGLAKITTNLSIHPLVMCLIFGVVFAEIGLLDRQVLTKANSFGLTITAIMAFVFDGLKNATPDMLLKVAGPLFGVIVIGVIGMLILAIVVGKVLKESIPMSICIAMNALYGFPPNYILTKESIQSLTEDEDEREYLDSIMMPKMLVGGFVSVTMASVIIGGIFVGML